MAIKKISEFTSGTPTASDKMLFEQNGSGKSATIGDIGKAINLNIDLLWTNKTPRNVFLGQSISLDLSKYKFIIISFYDTVNISMISTYISFKEENGHKVTIFTPTTLLSRQMTINDGGVTFGNGVGYRTYNSEEQEVSDYYVIPYKIYGVK